MPANTPTQYPRRRFLQVGATATATATLTTTAVFQLGWTASGAWAVTDGVASGRGLTGSTFAKKVNPFIKISTDNRVTLVVGQAEMGQGISTGLAMVLADELGADWSNVAWEQAPNDLAFALPGGFQSTGGSGSQRRLMPLYRRGAASAREMLIAAAAQKWNVDEKSCRVENSFVLHGNGEKLSKLSFGALAEAAARQAVPAEPPLKDRSAFTIIGTSPKRFDVPAKTNGSAQYGIDVKLPGMKYAVVARSPIFGAQVASFDAVAARKVKGVSHVVEIASGVAVVADNTWAAMKGRELLNMKWKESGNDKVSTVSIREQFIDAAKGAATKAREVGNVAEAFAKAGDIIEAVYETPYLAHATMEPMNCTAWVQANQCDVWAGVQAPTLAENAAVATTGLSKDKIHIHTKFLGGGFGRRSESDFVIEAVELSKQLRLPVQVLWTREDDMRHDFYRPMTYNVFRAALDDKGMPLAWQHRIVGSSILARRAPQNLRGGLDGTSTEGAATLPYNMPNFLCESVTVNTHVPVGFWRSVGSSQNAFITESFIDELAHKAGRDPFDYRRALMANNPRQRRVLELAAAQAEWSKPAPVGRFRGIAFAECFGGMVAQVVEVSVNNGTLKVHRVVCAVDVGLAVHPEIVKAQMQSAIVTGLDAARYGRITIENGAVVQGNFHDYPVTRINDMPLIEVYLTVNDQPPGGVGEPGTPPLAPALCNAIFAATGKRVRSLPLSQTDLNKT